MTTESVKKAPENERQTAVIIGAGPAGLTAAVELIRQAGITAVIVEATDEIGGLSRTIRHNGNRMDIGGHRFFSKSDRVMQWWRSMMPIEGTPEGADADKDHVMLVRERRSRILFLRRLFDYPLKLSAATLRTLGLRHTLLCGMSYLKSAVGPKGPEDNLEQFFVNRFGRRLYQTFFKSYTEKVWGMPCNKISSEWGAQRIKGLSLLGAVRHFLKARINALCGSRAVDVAQKGTETSLIERFLYPKFGPGQLWEYAADRIVSEGGTILRGITVDRLHCDGKRITHIEGVCDSGRRVMIQGDHFISTMPVKELLHGLGAAVPADVAAVGEGLVYRDFITVGLLVDRLTLTESDGASLKDNWIYIQEPDVQVGRVQIFNNWSPSLVSSPDKVWIGLEYFCNETDALWQADDLFIAALAAAEAAKIGLIESGSVSDSRVVRVPKAYPAYFGSYGQFGKIREFVDGIENLYLVGRNGMHRYNNADHSMLTAMAAVDCILGRGSSKESIWSVNTEAEYHEEKKGA